MRAERFSPLNSEDASYLLTQVEAFEPDWALVLPYVPAEARGAWLAVLGFAAEVIAAPGRVSNTMLGRIRLQWWREALVEIFEAEAVREHPTVRSMALTLRQETELAPLLGGMIDGMEAFLVHGREETVEAALDARRPVYGNLASVLGRLAGTPAGGEALALHALSRSAPDADAMAGEEGNEHPARRFARALGQNKGLEEHLAAAILARKSGGEDKELALPGLPLRLIRVKGGTIARVKNPFARKLAMFCGVLTGRL